MRRLAASAVLGLTAILIALPAPAAQTGTAAVGMTRALLASLDSERIGWVQTRFDDRERFNWNYTPVSRRGLPLREIEPAQRDLVWDIVDSALGERGRRQARQIIELEELLFRRSNGDERRDPGMYLLSVFGAPATRGAWGWRFEGHHLSLNFTMLDGAVVGTTPAFFGGNPARIGVESGRTELRPFAEEEDLARALLGSMTDAQSAATRFSSTVPSDILTGNDAVAARPVAMGVVWDDLDAAQQDALIELLSLYAARLAPSLAEAELAAIRSAGLEQLRFAWAGSVEAGEPHYYRIHGPTFVVEYDNAQDDANHIHTVWRNFDRDFGRDPLRAHVAAAHQAGPKHSLTAPHRHE